MSVSVVIPTHGRADRLPDAIRSVLAQDVATDVEVVVVNDGGPSLSEVVGAIEVPGSSRVRLVELERNGGPSVARNAGLAVTEGEIVGFLDDDDLYLPGHLAAALTHLDAGADLVYVDTPISRTRVTPHTLDEADITVHVAYPDDRGLLEVANHIPPTAVVCRSPRAVGVEFDVDLPVLEDWDFWLRLVRHQGFRTTFLPEPTVVMHRIPGVASLTVTSDDLTALRRYETLHRSMLERWPASSPAVEEARTHVMGLYQMAYEVMAAGQHLDHHYYERSLGVLYHWLGGTLDGDITEALRDTILGRSTVGTLGWRS